jgi:hypothetical protein
VRFSRLLCATIPRVVPLGVRDRNFKLPVDGLSCLFLCVLTVRVVFTPCKLSPFVTRCCRPIWRAHIVTDLSSYHSQ